MCECKSWCPLAQQAKQRLVVPMMDKYVCVTAKLSAISDAASRVDPHHHIEAQQCTTLPVVEAIRKLAQGCEA